MEGKLKLIASHFYLFMDLERSSKIKLSENSKLRRNKAKILVLLIIEYQDLQ